MSAADEKAGAFSYIKAPHSLIDHIFLSPNLVRHINGNGYFIVAKDKSVQNYANRLSDHRPVLVRLSLTEGVTAETREESIDDQIDELLKAGRQSGRRAVSAAF
jgi:hypothetical protein